MNVKKSKCQTKGKRCLNGNGFEDVRKEYEAVSPDKCEGSRKEELAK